MNYAEKFLIPPGRTIRLAHINPSFTGRHEDKTSAQGEVLHYTEKLRALQYQLYAENRRSLLIILQAMDAGGKDGTIRHVLGAMNPMGCRVQSFKLPSAEEASHDYLWRVHRAAPALGQVVIFNRSHYEDVLVTRVHGSLKRADCVKRFKEINEFEQYLIDNHVHILKFFLHIGKNEQLNRFKDRLDDPTHHWKISENDYAEREYWNHYMHAYEDVLHHCSTRTAPWFVIPSNHKWFRDLAVSQIVVHTLDSLGMKFPETKVDIEDIRRKYHRALREEKGAAHA